MVILILGSDSRVGGLVPAWMTAEQAWWWRIGLQLRLRQVHGDSFQEFFGTVMAKTLGSDYVIVRAFGSLGDKGCDGFRSSTGTFYACYGKLEDAGVQVSTLVSKIKEDFAKALTNFSGIMKEWHFVHNLTNGLPVEAVLAMEALKKANPTLALGFIGPEGLEKLVFELSENDLVGLLGHVGTAEHTKNMRIQEIAEIIDSIVDGVEANLPPTSSPKPVPFDKMEFNKIPHAWRQMLDAAAKNAAYVDDYLERTADPERGRKLAQIFKTRYQSLKAQGLSPNTIMANLYEGLTGIGSFPPERGIAAQALLAFLFESCDIFEDDASQVSA